MTKLLAPAFAGLLLAGIATPAFAQTGTAAPLAQAPGVAVVNLEAVVANSSAYRNAATSRQTTYKAQLDQAESRRQAISGQLKPLVDKFQKDQQAGVATPTLQQEAGTIQQIQQSGQQELQGILQPVALSEAYVQEQINDKLATAVQNAMAKKRISLLLNPSAVVSANNAYNLNQDVLNELNTLIPNAQIVPPAGWEPREVREQRAQQQGAAAPAAPAPASNKPKPSGR